MAKKYNYVFMVHPSSEDYPERVRRFVKLEDAVQYLESWVFKGCIPNRFFFIGCTALTVERIIHKKPFKEGEYNGYKLSDNNSASYYWIEPL